MVDCAVATVLWRNLTQLDEWTASLLTNREVIAMDQRGHGQHLAATDGDVLAWTSKGDGGVDYLAIFNLGDTPAAVKMPFVKYGLGAGKYKVRDVWEKSNLTATDEVSATIPPHGSVLLALRR